MDKAAFSTTNGRSRRYALKSAFHGLQNIGRAMMLPVSVLPIAGLLLGIGSANLSWIPPILSLLMAQAGSAVFAFLPLLFAIAIAVGLTENDGVAALAATVGYLVLLATMGVVSAYLALLHGATLAANGVVPAPDLIGQIRQVLATTLSQQQLMLGSSEFRPIMGIASIQTGVFGGILVGLVSAWTFERFYRIQLPPYLGFFSGKRSVPIITAFAAMALGVLLSFVWPPVGAVIQRFSSWAATGNPAAAFTLYGFVERLLIPLGLHHVWNVPFFFEAGQYLDPVTGQVARGEINRFIAGDPTAGNMAGGYLIKMWGLPAAALAIWHSAYPEHRKLVGGIMISAALTSFVTGITEPIEFTFLFLAPMLYVIHAVLAGLAYGLCILLGIKHGMTFSHGLIDFTVLYPKSHNALWLLVLGPIWGCIYYGVFRFAITRFNLKTPGREDDEVPNVTGKAVAASEPAEAFEIVRALGGRSNIVTLDACITRLRVKVEDTEKINATKLKTLGASGVVTVGNDVQAIFGTRSEELKAEIQEYLKVADSEADEIGEASHEEKAPIKPSPVEQHAVPASAIEAGETSTPDKIIAALGGAENIEEVSACAETRVRVVLKTSDRLDEQRMHAAGILGIARLPNNIVHLLAGKDAEHYADEICHQLGEVAH